MSERYIVGFDPGGINAFGWAVLSGARDQLTFIASGTCSSAKDAIEDVSAKCPLPPVAVGIDAPLVWAKSGDRKCDETVRGLVLNAALATGTRASSGTVSHVNSIRGACLVQGVLVATFAAERWPRTQITETHPKALRWIYPGLRIQHGCPSDIESRDHEWDAVIAAYSAFQFVQRTEGWSDLYESELEKFLPSNYSATYWFPNRLQIKGR
jgi:predicted nuclease with RNAse H fold